VHGIVRATVDTGWVIAASRNPTAARRHIAALTRLGQVLVASPIVVVESRQRAADLGPIEVILSQLEQEALLPEDGRRASDLLRAAGRQSSDPSSRIHEIGTADALIAAMAERIGDIVYTADPTHMEWLRDAGADVTVQPVPF
jgi:predicted nucleic acid-binding protein